MKIRAIPTTLLCLCMLSGISYAVDNYPMAGVTPWQRPVGAPVIEWVQHDRNWYEKSLTGIKPIYPRSLYFLDNQGNWYTPFTRPGMLRPYDLRGWHQ